MSEETSASKAVKRFDSPQAAQKYAASLGTTGTHRRELACIEAMLADVPPASAVLDLPCGSGRLLGLLTGRGYTVTEADSSPHMLEQARQSAGRANLFLPPERFVVADVLKTPFADDAFDAVVCNRLFHHLLESPVRQAALRELGRICKGPIVISFFRSLALDALSLYLKHFIHRRPILDRKPIGLGVFRKDIEAAGLTLCQARGVRPLVSKNWYVLLKRRQPA